MSRPFALLGIALLGCGAMLAADWLNAGGDASHSGWQKRTRFFKQADVSDFALLWKKHLDNETLGNNSLSTPVMLGPVVTHRGVKELVFVAGSSNNVYAVDADLGRIIWTRHFDVATRPCGNGMTASPAMEPEPAGTKVPQDEDDPDYHAKMRPIYVLPTDGMLHSIWPSTGIDTGAPLPFLPPNAEAGNLTFANGSIATSATAGCGTATPGRWVIDVKSGTVKQAGPVVKEITSATMNNMTCQVNTKVTCSGAWSSGAMVHPLQPVFVNDVLFVLDGGSKDHNAVLYAFHARTGKQMYTSGTAIESYVNSSGLAAANGHVTFATADNTLYCFGFPIEI